MAIQFARCQYVSRSTGGNACRKAAYNERTSIACERTGETFSYAAKGDVSHHEILLPEGVDPRFGTSSVLWNEAERCEKRKDSQVAKELVIALPDDKQLTLADRIELSRRFAQTNFIDKGVAVQLDLHAPDEDEKNWHAHLLVTTRRFREDGQALAATKATDLDPIVRGARHTVVEADLWGEIWRDTQNSYFAEVGYDLRVDPIGILAQEHLGPVRMRHHMNQALERADQLQRVNDTLSHKPTAILEALTRHTAVFTERDVETFLRKHSVGDEMSTLKENVLSHLSVIPLYDKETGELTPFFTTGSVRAEEEKLLRFTDAIAKKPALTLSPLAIEKGVEGRTLSEEQRLAYDSCVQSEKNLVLIQGRAGVGKSYVLDAIRTAHEAEGIRVLGLAPTHKVATALKDSGFQEAKTCHGFLFALKHGKETLDSRTLVVVDEAAMLGSTLSVELFNAVKKSGAKLILVGDDRQLSSVERPGAFGVLAERYGAIELQDVRRQTISWQKAVSEDLSRGDVKRAVRILQTNECIVWQPSKEESLAELLKTWAQAAPTGGLHQILAQRNVDVDALNQGAREILKNQGKLGELELTCQTQRGPMTFAEGDRIQLTKTDKAQGLENGRFGVIAAINPTTKTLTLKMDNQEIKEVDPSTYNGLRHGYAATVYKAQGATLDHVYVLHGKTTNQSTSYVALTRQTKSLSLYVAKEETPTEHALIQQMSRAETKGSSLLFDTLRDIERRQEDKPFTTHMKQEVEDLFTKMRDTFHANRKFYQSEKQNERPGEVTLTQKMQKGFWKEIHPMFSRSQDTAFIAEKEKDLEYRTNKTLQELAGYIKDKLHDMEAYAGTSLARKAGDELHSYLTTLEKNEGLFLSLKGYNPQLMKEAQQVFREQDHHLEQSHGRGMGLGM